MKPKCRSCSPEKSGVGGIPLMKHEYSKRDMIHQHMISHYRRLYNAKSEIDNKPPQYFKPHYMPPPRPSLPEPNLPVQTGMTKEDEEYIHDLGMGYKSDWNTGNSRLAVKLPEDKTTWVQRILLSFHSKISEIQDQDKLAALPHITNTAPVNKIMEKRETVHCRAAENKFPGSNIHLQHLETRMNKKTGLCLSSKLHETSVHHPARRRKQAKPLCKVCTRGTNRGGKKELKPRSPKKLKECMSPETKRRTRAMVQSQKEELKYLKFIQDITQDILANDIYTNEGLNQIFEAHVQRNKGKLSMTNMRIHIENLKSKLDIPCISQDLDDPTKNIFRSVETNVGCCSFLNAALGNISHEESLQKISTEPNPEEGNKIPESESADQEGQVLSLLQNMGFDLNMAEEICQCMSDRDFLSSLKLPGGVENTWFDEQILAELLPLSVTRKDEEALKPETSQNITELAQPATSGTEDKTSEPTESQETNENNVNKVQEKAPQAVLIHELCTGDKKSTVAETPVYLPVGTGAGDAVTCVVQKEGIAIDREKPEECKKPGKDMSKMQTSGDGPCSVANSPIGSDYSSMKDHDESGYDCSAGRDESRESASEVEEEISDALSQDSSSSSISQLAERLRHFSVEGLPSLVSRCSAGKVD